MLTNKLSRFLIVFSLIVLFVAAVFVKISILDGLPAVNLASSLAPHRNVENFQCSGDCSNVVVVDTSYPGVRYVGDGPTCAEANIWVNKTNDGRVLVNGYIFFDGVQESLDTVTFDEDVLDGRTLEYDLPRYSRSVQLPEGVDVFPNLAFDLRLNDSGDWNLLQALDRKETPDASQDSLVVSTDFEDGSRRTLFDSCSAAAKSTIIYSLYAQPDLHGPDTDNTYSVGLVRVDLPSTGSTTGFTAVSDRHYSSDEFSDEIEHVTILAGDATFDFDLVRDGEW